MGKKRLFSLLCMLFIAAALLMRIAFITSESLWGDENFTVRFVEGSMGGIIQKTIHDVHPPLYFIVMHFWTGAFGFSEAALRIPSVISSLAAIFVFYLLCRRLGLDALLGTTLFALSLSGLVYAHEARSYSILILFIVAAWYYLAGIMIQNKGYFGYGVMNVLMIYTHVLGLAVFAITTAFVVFSVPKNMFFGKKFVYAIVLPAVLFLPWLPAFFIQIRDFLPLILERLALNTNGIVTPVIFWVLFAGGGFFCAAAVLWKVFNGDQFSLLHLYGIRVKHLQKYALFIVIIWIVFFISMYNLFAATTPFVRYLLFMQPLAYLVLAHIVEKKKYLAVILMVFSVVLLAVNASTIDRFDWRNATSYALSFDDGETIYAFDRAGSSIFLLQYYSEHRVDERILKLYVEAVDGNDILYPIEELDAGQRYVLIVSKTRGEASEYEAYLRTTHQVAAEKEFKDINIIIFEPIGLR